MHDAKAREVTERNAARGRASLLAFSGQIALLLGDDDEAANAFAEVLALVGEDVSPVARSALATARLGRGYLLLAKGKFAQSSAEFNASAKQFDDLDQSEPAMQSRVSALDSLLFEGDRKSFSSRPSHASRWPGSVSSRPSKRTCS